MVPQGAAHAGADVDEEEVENLSEGGLARSGVALAAGGTEEGGEVVLGRHGGAA